MTKTELIDQVAEARGALDEAEKALLRQTGWRYTCQTPGSFWFWEKTLADGRTLLVPQATAVQIAMMVDL